MCLLYAKCSTWNTRTPATTANFTQPIRAGWLPLVLRLRLERGPFSEEEARKIAAAIDAAATATAPNVIRVRERRVLRAGALGTASAGGSVRSASAAPKSAAL